MALKYRAWESLLGPYNDVTNADADNDRRQNSCLVLHFAALRKEAEKMEEIVRLSSA